VGSHARIQVNVIGGRCAGQRKLDFKLLKLGGQYCSASDNAALGGADVGIATKVGNVVAQQFAATAHPH
jgi:hypothetical protein